MKELSIEEKAKAYDEAIEKLRGMIPNWERLSYNGKTFIQDLTYIFPELKESEDERISKEIRDFICWATDRGSITKEQMGKSNLWLAWLEKQGEQEKSTKEKLMALSDDKQHLGWLDDADKVIESEQKPADTDNKFIRMRETKPKDISEFLDRLTTVEQEFLWEHIAKIRELDKNEQKPADKVEPKFKVGDWINGYYTNYKVLSVNNDGYVVEDVDGNKINILFENEKFHHLWTIQDAKEGDVLFTSSTASYETFIFKSIDEIGNAECYFSYDSEDGFREGKYHFIGRVTNCKPTTKEQRNLLFQKMKEAGYEWDAEKKELRKIEQKPTNNVIEEEKPLLEKFKQAVYDCAWGKVTCKKEGETKEEYANRWAEHFLLIVRDWADDYIDFTIQQKLRNSYEKGKTDIIEKQDEQNPVDGIAVFEVGETITDGTQTFTITDIIDEHYIADDGDKVSFYVAHKYYTPFKEQKPVEWSEEDKKMISMVITDLNLAHDVVRKGVAEKERKKEIEWLESFKDRCLPQPNPEWSEEDDKMINSIAVHLNATTGGFPEDKAWADKFMIWLKSLKDRVQPYSKQEWSEEDEKIRSSIINFIRYELNHHAYIGMAGVNSAQQIEWLQSLHPQPHWKPSDEQVEALWDSIKHNLHLHPVLESLYNDLKKLI